MTSLSPRRIQWRPARQYEIELPRDTGMQIGTIGPQAVGQRIQIARLYPPADPTIDNSWSLLTGLPGFTEARTSGSEDDAKALADQLLAGFVGACGAEFVEASR